MLFNLVGPLIVSGDVDPLLNILSSRGLPIPSGRIRGVFEYEDRRVFNEDSGQPTSIDLVLQDERGAPFVFLESKFAEKEFGGCSVFANGDCDGRNPSSQFDLCYLHFIGRTYWSLLEKHGFLSERAGHNVTCILSSYYQFFRELLLAVERDGKFVLLFDSRNPTFLSDGRPGQRGLVPFLLECVPPHLKQQVVTVTVQELVTAIKSSNRHPWISEFERKYGLSAL